MANRAIRRFVEREGNVLTGRTWWKGRLERSLGKENKTQN